MLATAVDLATKLQRPIPSDQADQALWFASEAVRAYLGQHISQNVYTEAHAVAQRLRATGDGSREFVGYVKLRQRPVSSVSSVTADGASVPFSVDDVTGDVLVANELARVTVTYAAGYAEIPAAIKAVVLSLAADEVLNVGQVSEQRLGDYSVKYRQSGGSGLTYLHKAILNRYASRVDTITQGD